MKNSMIAVLVILLALPMLGMASKPNPNTFNGCIQRPYTECGWDGIGSKEWMDCANPIYDECRCKFRPELVENYNREKDCSKF